MLNSELTQLAEAKSQAAKQGFSIINNIYSPDKVEALCSAIDNLNTSNPLFRKSKDLFAIRQFMKEAPELKPLIFTPELEQVIRSVSGDNCFLVKSIYFDKPPQSNWFVAYHQDLTISVKEKIAADGFENWTVKHQQFAVQPPLAILEDNFTIRIHLDDTTAANGALKVIPGSHLKGIYRPETLAKNGEPIYCEVNRGGIMIMKPLLMHASDRTINEQRRRVIHLEFSRTNLPKGMVWAEA
mgnify:FL=1